MENKLDPIDVATQFIGTNNRSIFNNWFYATKGVTTAYCGTFVSYCRQMGAMPLPRMDYMRGFSSVTFAVNFFKTRNQLTQKPQRNDIVFFDWTGNKANFEHTGLFKCDNGDGATFTSIEGNTSNPAIPGAGNQSNGGWVIEKIRPYTCAIFAHPVIENK
jgi:CHAP domain-containing protein